MHADTVTRNVQRAKQRARIFFAGPSGPCRSGPFVSPNGYSHTALHVFNENTPRCNNLLNGGAVNGGCDAAQPTDATPLPATEFPWRGARIDFQGSGSSVSGR
jgi:hypothetical protein